jgi:ankyrin repeat protein
MYATPLPPRPNLEQYKKLAKDLVKACKTGDREAILEWSKRWLETLATLMDVPGPDRRDWFSRQLNQIAEFVLAKLSKSKCALADAQFVIARVHSFKSWPKFAKHIEALTSASSPVSKFESAADAVVNGDIATLERLLREDPDLIRAHSTRDHQATLLHYVAANGVEDFRQKTPKNAVAVVELLLKAGAEVDASNWDYGQGTALGLVATSIHPWLAGVQNALLETLLDHGAAVDGLPGGWSPLISALHNDRPEAAAFLAARGARLDLEGAAGVGRLDVVKSFFKEESIRTESGSDRPRLTSSSDRAPIRTESGSDRPRLTTSSDRAPIRTGSSSDRPYLTSSSDRAIRTGSSSDRPLLTTSSDRVSRLQGATNAQLQSGFIWACEYGRKDVVEFLLDKGVDLRAGENTGQTALHLAAHRGQLDIIKLLLERGAPLEARNVYGGTVLGQAMWSVMHGERSIDFVPVIETLLAAGARIEQADYLTGNERVDEVLRRHGARSVRPADD